MVSEKTSYQNWNISGNILYLRGLFLQAKGFTKLINHVPVSFASMVP